MHVNNLWNYRNLGMGNYIRRPIIVESGRTRSVRIRLAGGVGATAAIRQ
jgi:hypothetical protein